MHAWIADRYGPPEVLAWRELTPRELAPHEVRVRVHAAAVNPADVHLLRGEPFFLRLTGLGLWRPKHRVPGTDVAGLVEAVGRDVRAFEPGDAVFADLSSRGRGAFAERVVAPEDAWIPVPPGVSLEAAASAPMAAVTALQGLRDAGTLEPGHEVLVHGASGGVGTFAVQIAVALGARVTAVASARNLDLVRSLGAARAIDYAAEDFTAAGDRYDLIFDTVGNRSVPDLRRALHPDGAFVTTAFLPALAGPRLGGARRGPRMVNLLARSDRGDLAAVGELLASGAVVPVVDRRYPLRDAVDALRHVATRRARGKVVLLA
jgi:NADPH:quinone reductase-like Zn-dependent oxidoreductase